MRLSSIKLAGFKSFVEPTKIPFPDPMTCVVGPNGCGKSNVIDAVRWVLGESSAKNLRGDAMTDVIFNGSTNRKAISQASVELVFDNATGRLPGTLADRSQVAIKRLVTRDGQSLYFLNGSKCRKRDITDIFLGTGLGPRSYAIIEQGMISRLIESKPQELRIFLEEAAGVSKYKERRRETQTRIKSTRDNLERLLDVRQELQAQLDKLATQAQDAQSYRALKAQERTLKSELAVLKWQSFHQKQLQKSEQIAQLQKQIEFLNSAHGGHDDVLASLENEVLHFSDGIAAQQQSIHQTHTELTRGEQQKIHLLDKLRQLQSDIDKQQQAYREASSLLVAQKEHVNEHEEAVQLSAEEALVCEAQFHEYAQLHQSLVDAFHALEVQQAQLQQQQTLAQKRVHEAQQSVSQAQQVETHNREKCTALEEQLTLLLGQDPTQELTDLQAQYSHKAQEMARLQANAKALGEEVDLSTANISEQQSDCMQKQADYASCVANIDALLKVLKTTQAGEVDSFINKLRVKKGFEERVEAALLGIVNLQASDGKAHDAVWLSSAERKAGSVASVIESGNYPDFLNQIQLVEKEEHYKPQQWLFAIDNDGCLMGRNWHASAKSQQQNSGLLLQHAQLRELEQQLPILEAKQSAAQSELAQLTQKHTVLLSSQSENKEHIHQLAQEMASVKTRIDMLQEQIIKWQNDQQTLHEQLESIQIKQQHDSQKYAEYQQLLRDEQAQFTSLEQQQTDFSMQFAEAKQAQQSALRDKQQAQQAWHDAKLNQQQATSTWQLSQTKAQHLEQSQAHAQERLHTLQEEQMLLQEPLAEIDEQIVSLLATHEAQQQLLTELQAGQSKAKEQLHNKQVSLKNAQSEVQQLNNKLQQLKFDEQGLMIKAQGALEPLQELQQNLKAVLEQLPDEAEQAKHQSQLNKVSQSLVELGAVNLAAIEEFEQAKERKDYLDAQLDDLTAALATLEGAIKKIDKETKTRFKTTFDQVNEDLAELFPKVFGGGSAYLELTSDDLLESGVTIMARPPGKKNSTIHLLSGGEKALTALSLVFSIFRLNPAPFCMLDEVDAPLDDANVGRFCRLVEEMSQTVQFIYISHNKIAMEMAGRLTGVTMAEPGVSRMVAVDIEQAVQMAQA